MNATIKSEKKHFPVLLHELISIISPLYGGTFIDCTFGQGGYSNKILEHLENKVFAVDRDKATHKKAEILKKKFGKRFNFKNITFKDIHKINFSKQNIKGIIFDLGYSTTQIHDPLKGISFSSIGKLNMRMGLNNFSADEVVNKLDEESLFKIFKFYGEEKFSKLIAKKIIFEIINNKIQTQDLVRIIDKVKKYKRGKIHNSTKVFQSLRIFVNQEISQLIMGLINGFKILPVGGIIAVITFNSLEDKIVKYFFKNYSEKKNVSRYLPEVMKGNNIFKNIQRKPIVPSIKEITNNPPSRSAKLRYAIKTDECNNFKDFINNFDYLLKIESISQRL